MNIDVCPIIQKIQFEVDVVMQPVCFPELLYYPKLHEHLTTTNASTSNIGSPLISFSPKALKQSKHLLRRKLKILSLNCNGLKSLKKKAQFNAIINLHQPDVILGCES